MFENKVFKTLVEKRATKGINLITLFY